MKASISQFPSGEEYLAVQCSVDWHEFPTFAEHLLIQLHAYAVESPTKGQAVDAHWYDFSWHNEQYRLVYGDWPPECLIEKITSNGDLKQMGEAISKIVID